MDWLQQDMGYWSTEGCALSVAEDILENYLNNFSKLASLVVAVSSNTIYSKFQTAVMKHIGMVKCLYVPSGVTLFEV